ncbi:MAG TPA: hypothetical protein VJT73_10660 [Polyangiaceae bacterium]|nr:hypothetical protein [Polyangiaceae bacterium]
MTGNWARVASFLTLAIAGACSSDEPGKAVAEGCLINTDCQTPLVCAFRRCHMQCTTSRDCDTGQRCVASDRPYHVCQLEEEKSCSYNTDCPKGQTCGLDLQCRDECTADRDCVREQTCVAGTCAETIELVDGGLPALVSDAGAPPVGQPCSYTSQCAGQLICLNNLCANECLGVLDCPAGSNCVNTRCVPGTGKVIGPSGGIVEASGGKIALSIPAGALAESVAVSIVALEAWPKGATSSVVQILPSGLAFKTPASLTLHYEDKDLGTTPPSALRIGNAVGTVWQPLASTVDAANRAVSADLAHLSIYGLIAPTQGGESENDAGESGTAEAGIGGTGGAANQPGQDAAIGGAGGSSAAGGGKVADASSGQGGGRPADAAQPVCTAICEADAGAFCNCHTVGPCDGHAYACAGAQGTCTCTIDDAQGRALVDVSCNPSTLSRCGFPIIVQ